MREGEARGERQLDTSGQALMTIMVEFPCESAVGGCGLPLLLLLLQLSLSRIRCFSFMRFVLFFLLFSLLV